MDKIIAYTAGKARGNPGPASTGVYITNEAGDALKEVKEFLGNGNNNFAEYYGVMLALQTLKQLYNEKTKSMQFEVRLSGELVKKQLNSEIEINEPGLVPMFIEIHNMTVASFPKLTFTQVSTEKNKEAERLVNEALESK
jgi:ribonuclease HI